MDSTSHIQVEPIRHTVAHRHTTHLGKWELLGPVGQGEWSTVYRARPRDCAVDWPADYAIKVARAGSVHSARAQTLIAREATIGRTVIHPHLITVLSAQLETTPYFLVMPLLQGATLQTVLEACGPLPPRPRRSMVWTVKCSAMAPAKAA